MEPKVPNTKASLSLAMIRFGVFMSLLTCTQGVSAQHVLWGVYRQHVVELHVNETWCPEGVARSDRM